MKSMKALALLFAAAMPLAACGDDGTPSDTTGGDTEEPDTESDPSGSPTSNPSTSLTTTPSTSETTPTTGETETTPTTGETETTPTTGETETSPTTTGETETSPTTTGETETSPTTTGETETSPTTTGETETSPTTTGETDTSPTTTTGETTTGETTTGVIPGDGYAGCFPDDGTCIDGEICLFANAPGTADHSTVCSLQDCATADDCPAAPATGNPTVSCEDLTQDGVTDCVLSCADGETCPDGMICAFDLVCATPPEWTCDFSFFGVADGCDCGCGITDTDCADSSVDSCEFCDDTGSCDQDGGGCPGGIDADDNAVCDPLLQWTCDEGAFDDGAVCDCGCGAVDPDCADATQASCDECNGTGSCAEDQADCSIIVDDNNATCGAPDGWTCNPAFWGTADGCDCGCGAFDIDCADMSVASCEFCNDTGSCDDTGADCPGIIDADMNWLCE